MNAIQKSNVIRRSVESLFRQPFNELLHAAHSAHRWHFNPNRVQLSTLLSIKTGGCQENCGYCSQSAHHDTDVKATKLMQPDAVREAAQSAKKAGATRFCMGAAWRALKDRDLDAVCDLVSEVKSLGLETCVTAGMISDAQAIRLKESGLDYYNHNLDTSRAYYDKVVSTRTYDDRLETIGAVRTAGLKVCTGGIIGMGESRDDRIGLISELASMDPQPESVPINVLVPQKGTPMESAPPLDVFELVRTIAVTRLSLKNSYVRLSAGRESLSDEAQALCFHAGANSIFYGEKLLTSGNAEAEKDLALFAKLNLKPETEIRS